MCRAQRLVHQPQHDTTSRQKRGERENVRGGITGVYTRCGTFPGVVWIRTRVGTSGVLASQSGRSPLCEISGSGRAW